MGRGVRTLGYAGAMKPTALLAALALLCTTAGALALDDAPGHSAHGSAFDTGLRQKPWKMEGIGRTHFPITCKTPEVQEWFDQGNTLLHSFWFEEAERSFRWCLKLDPDCAMAYWGLSVTGLNWFDSFGAETPEHKRGLDFLREAVRRKASASPRERMYIEAWDAGFNAKGDERSKTMVRELEKIVLAYPDDVEAKALYALYSIDDARSFATELVIRQVLAAEPDHPGAHHYRIHNWDGAAPAQALESCRRYGPIAPNVGHANHMPGHNYTKLGMWHEAGFSMDSATRVELRYMSERLALPFETWNYAHNRNYLCYIQEQLGMERASLAGARAMLRTPRDPSRNKDEDYGAIDQGMSALVRCLIKFERWDEILRPGAIPWRDTPLDKRFRPMAEAFAHIGKGNLPDARARLRELRTLLAADAPKDRAPDAGQAPAQDPLLDAAEGLIAAAEGDVLEASRFLLAAAAAEHAQRKKHEFANDPPMTPWPIDRILGDVYLARGQTALAAEAYGRALKAEANDAFTLSGLARAEHALGHADKAAEYAARLEAVWCNADPDLPWRTSVAALGLKPAPHAETPAPERVYRPELLDALGPANWEPFAAPELDCTDSDGQRVRLQDLRGKNVLLVFYLNDDCVHCMEQLKAINDHASDWSGADCVTLAVSSSTPEKNKQSKALAPFSIRLLSDRDHENARRFTSYDDFEEMELHSTILIDARGRVHWKRTGGDPFTDMDFLIKELKRMNDAAAEEAKAQERQIKNPSAAATDPAAPGTTETPSPSNPPNAAEPAPAPSPK